MTSCDRTEWCIGSRDEEAIAIMRDLYRPLYLIEAPFVLTSA